MPTPHLYVRNTVFIILFLVSLYLFGKLLWPYLVSFVLALILVAVFYNWYEWLLLKFKGKSGKAALVTCILVFFIVGIPSGIFLGLMTKEAIDLISWAKSNLSQNSIREVLVHPWVQGNLQTISSTFNVDLSLPTVTGQIRELGKDLGVLVYQQGKNITANIFGALFNLVLLFFIMFYFFRDGKKILRRIMDISPLPEEQEWHIVQKFSQVGAAVFWGNLAAALLQGLAGALGFVFFGLNQAALFGFATAIFSLVPAVGTLIIFIPTTIYLFLTGHVAAAIGYCIYNIIFSNLIDNYVKPKLIESKIKVHPLLVFFSIIGGVQVFGLLGVLYGPLIVTLFLTMVEIYEHDGLTLDDKH